MRQVIVKYWIDVLNKNEKERSATVWLKVLCEPFTPKYHVEVTIKTMERPVSNIIILKKLKKQ